MRSVIPRGDQQVQRAFRPTVGDVDDRILLTATECAEVGHRPIEANKLQQALNKTGRLPERHAEPSRGFARSGLKTVHWTVFRAPFPLHRQARLDGGVTAGLLATTPA